MEDSSYLAPPVCSLSHPMPHKPPKRTERRNEQTHIKESSGLALDELTGVRFVFAVGDVNMEFISLQSMENINTFTIYVVGNLTREPEYKKLLFKH